MLHVVECAKLLPPGGRIAFTHVVARGPLPLWVRIALRLMNVHGVATVDGCKSHLHASGFECDVARSLEPHVLARWLPQVYFFKKNGSNFSIYMAAVVQ